MVLKVERAAENWSPGLEAALPGTRFTFRRRLLPSASASRLGGRRVLGRAPPPAPLPHPSPCPLVPRAPPTGRLGIRLARVQASPCGLCPSALVRRHRDSPGHRAARSSQVLRLQARGGTAAALPGAAPSPPPRAQPSLPAHSVNHPGPLPGPPGPGDDGGGHTLVPPGQMCSLAVQELRRASPSCLSDHLPLGRCLLVTVVLRGPAGLGPSPLL